ncbi:hypothetical protein [Halosimplex pelagicum]|uniref:Uncharacterized protein n=1 Tax=Halosimplex pelagicum TaxID=869886 RepID=A0A7D5P763_9EURY|nr:hypothetical protein [Halosimplex pelagicum]QLH82461.1 hypothetical protein HZS54_12925 [Halosimplex pelagicum]QLH82517.1 hypothetical protein HZS54_13230 [Halosimplex pelagicum]
MPTRSPPTQPEQEMIDLLVAKWDPSMVRGYDLEASPDHQAHMPAADSIDNVGAVFPSLVVSFSNETSGGESTFDFMTERGPGQSPQGVLLATARAEDHDEDNYRGSDDYAAVDAGTIVDEIAGHALDICREHWSAPGTGFTRVGGQRGPDAPDDLNEDPPVRIAQRQLNYGALYVP